VIVCVFIFLIPSSYIGDISGKPICYEMMLLKDLGSDFDLVRVSIRCIFRTASRSAPGVTSDALPR